VGRADYGDNRFCGRSVNRELAGRASFWQLLSIAVGHPGISTTDSDVLDALSSCCCAADPRIWPLKLGRLAAAFGDRVAGLCATFSGATGLYGPRTTVRCGRWIEHALGDVGPSFSSDDIRTYIDKQIDAGASLSLAFGVPHREQDERVVALVDYLTIRGRLEHTAWRFLAIAAEHMLRSQQKPINIAAAAAATMLDIGFAPRQMELISYAVLLPAIAANMQEGGDEPSSLLQVVDPAKVRYVGRPARGSERLQATVRSPTGAG
jgi:hypothetical protein